MEYQDPNHRHRHQQTNRSQDPNHRHHNTSRARALQQHRRPAPEQDNTSEFSTISREGFANMKPMGIKERMQAQSEYLDQVRKQQKDAFSNYSIENVTGIKKPMSFADDMKAKSDNYNKTAQLKYINQAQSETQENDDPIYGKNFWGKVEQIGDDGKEDGKSYLVKGSVKRAVKKATKEGKDYTGPLVEGKKVMNIPTGGVMDDVIESVEDTKASERENGGHYFVGDSNATRWDQGPAAIGFIHESGQPAARASLSPFIVDGEHVRPDDSSNVAGWWHTHPKTEVNGVELGSSTPSLRDKKYQDDMKNHKFKGNTFVIGVRDGNVTFYNEKRELITVKYDDFLRMGGKLSDTE